MTTTSATTLTYTASTTTSTSITVTATTTSMTTLTFTTTSVTSVTETSPTTPTMTPPTTTEVVHPGHCVMFGDPHLVTFDGKGTHFTGPRHIWLVKPTAASNEVEIQGRSLGRAGNSAGIAVSGSFVNAPFAIVQDGYDAGGKAKFKVTYDEKP